MEGNAHQKVRIGIRDSVLLSWAIRGSWLVRLRLLVVQTSPWANGVSVEDIGLELAYVEIIV